MRKNFGSKSWFYPDGFIRTQKVHNFISTHLLTVLIIGVILQIEQRKGVQKRGNRKGSENPYRSRSSRKKQITTDLYKKER